MSGVYGTKNRGGNVLKLIQKDWKHIIEGHVKSTFDATKRIGKDVSTVFKGTPQEYAAMLEKAVQNSAVVKEMTKAIKEGRTMVDIPVTFWGQTMKLKVNVRDGTIESFHAYGRITNPSKFEVIKHLE
jgi:hypothetical protein